MKRCFMWSNFVYISIDIENNKVVSSGIDFHDFTNAIGACENYLLLAGEPEKSNFSMNLQMEYVSKDQADDFLKMSVEDWGDFCWVDFQDEKDLEMLSKREQAEMLYMGHKKEPLQNYRIHGLRNEFAYLCHDDGIWNQIYMKDLELYNKVFKYILDRECGKLGIKKINLLKNGEIHTLEIENQNLKLLFELSFSGLIMDFKNIDVGSVQCYVINKSLYTVDELEEVLELKRSEYFQLR